MTDKPTGNLSVFLPKILSTLSGRLQIYNKMLYSNAQSEKFFVILHHKPKTCTL